MAIGNGKRAAASLVVALLFLSGPVSAAAQEDGGAVIIYGNVGPTFPVFDAMDEYPVGVHGGGGFGVALSSSEPLSTELVTRLEVNHFAALEEKAEDNCLILGLESKVRYPRHERARPYFALGLGTYFPHSAVFLGIGTDLDVDRSGQYFFYAELKYVHTEIDLFRLDIGLRLG